jgi:hypothetical protein
MIKNVYKSYGPYGIYRGFTTSYYSSAVAGFAFFAIYKGLKIKLKEIFEPKTQNQCSIIYLVASMVAEAITLAMYYPYEIIKVRIIAKNDIYQYKSLPDAFIKMFK